jgi:uncharacterized membrane protein
MTNGQDPTKTAGATVACAGAVLLPLPVPVRLVAAVALVLFLPGHAFALAGGLGSLPRDAFEYRLFEVATSIAVVIVTGLGLDVTAWGLTRTSWAVGLGAVTLVLLAWSLRRPRAPATPRPTAARRRPSLAAVAAIVVTIGTAGVAVDVAARAARDQDAAIDVVQLWVIPDEGGEVRVGVANHEGRDASYRILVDDGSPGGQSYDIEVPDDGTWERPLPPAASNAPGTTRVTLARPGTSQPLRSVWVTQPQAKVGAPAGPAQGAP